MVTEPQGAAESTASVRRRSNTPDLPTFLRCPACGNSPLPAGDQCATCHQEIRRVSGIPLLIDDLSRHETAIEAALTSTRGDWYRNPHDTQLVGPYRHHLAKRRKYLDDALERFGIAPRAGRVSLDLGCGDGIQLEWLRSYGGDVYGSDYNLDRLLRARTKVGAEWLFLADATDYPADDASFDLVFMNHVLEHIPDDRKALTEVHRILKPGGVAVIGVPNEGAGWWRLAYRLQPAMRRNSDHVHFYTAKSLVERCVSVGFEVREVEHLGWGLPHFSWDARIRGTKSVDDTFEMVGRRFFRSQASSLYIILGR